MHRCSTCLYFKGRLKMFFSKNWDALAKKYWFNIESGGLLLFKVIIQTLDHVSSPVFLVPSFTMFSCCWSTCSKQDWAVPGRIDGIWAHLSVVCGVTHAICLLHTCRLNYFINVFSFFSFLSPTGQLRRGPGPYSTGHAELLTRVLMCWWGLTGLRTQKLIS